MPCPARADVGARGREAGRGGEYAIAVEARMNHVDVPLAANHVWRTDTDFTSYDPRTAGNSPVTGFGAVSTGFGSKVWEEPAFTAFCDAQVIFPTATSDDLGRGKYQLAPALLMSIPTKCLDTVMFLGFQQTMSSGGDPNRKNVNYTKLNLEMRRRG